LAVNELAKTDWERKTTADAANAKKTFFISVLLSSGGLDLALRPPYSNRKSGLVEGPG